MKSVRSRGYSVQMQENTDQNNSEYGDFLRIVLQVFDLLIL